MNTLLIRSVIATTLMLAMAVRLKAASPTVGALKVAPSNIAVNTPTTVLFTIAITDPLVVSNGVNLVSSDSTGRAQAVVGPMHDDGLNGDAVAGDKVFSYRTTLNEKAAGLTYFRVSAPFKGVLQRVLSNVSTVHIEPFVLPPDPGEAGKQTIEGVDADSDGIRDDVQRSVIFTYQSDQNRRLALLQSARALQRLLTTDVTAVAGITAAGDEIRRGNDCLEYVAGAHNGAELFGTLLADVLNTPARSFVYTNAQRAIRTQGHRLAPMNELRAGCSFAITQ